MEDPGSVIPPFVAIFYCEDVRIMMKKKQSELGLIWNDIVQIAVKNGVKEAKKGATLIHVITSRCRTLLLI